MDVVGNDRAHVLRSMTKNQRQKLRNFINRHSAAATSESYFKRRNLRRISTCKRYRKVRKNIEKKMESKSSTTNINHNHQPTGLLKILEDPLAHSITIRIPKIYCNFQQHTKTTTANGGLSRRERTKRNCVLNHSNEVKSEGPYSAPDGSSRRQSSRILKRRWSMPAHRQQVETIQKLETCQQPRYTYPLDANLQMSDEETPHVVPSSDDPSVQEIFDVSGQKIDAQVDMDVKPIHDSLSFVESSVQTDKIDEHIVITCDAEIQSEEFRKPVILTQSALNLISFDPKTCTNQCTQTEIIRHDFNSQSGCSFSQNFTVSCQTPVVDCTPNETQTNSTELNEINCQTDPIDVECSSCQTDLEIKIRCSDQSSATDDLLETKDSKDFHSIPRLSSSADVGDMSNFRKFIHFETHPNGGGTMVRAYAQDLKHLPSQEYKKFARYFLNTTLMETNQLPDHVIGVIHGAAAFLPDLCEYFGRKYPTMPVKVGSLTSKQDLETMTFSDYRHHVHETYSQGTFRYGPTMSVSLVGTRQEECGDYCSDLLDRLER